MKTLFDKVEAQRRRDAGQSQAESRRETLLDQARQIAREFCQNVDDVTSDEVALIMRYRGLDYSLLGNAAGSVFKGFAWTGRVVQSKRPSTHGRIIRVWRLK